MTQQADVVIVGAGIMGCSAAFHLAQRGMQVTVLEREHIGAGGTGRSSAIIRQHYSHELTSRMALYSLRIFERFREAIGADCGFTRTGWVALASPEYRAAAEANVAMHRRLGIRTELVDVKTVRDLIPGIRVDDAAVAVYEPDSGYADPHLTVTGYADAARRLGARFVLGEPVTAVRFDGDRVAGVSTPRAQYDAPILIDCAGPWASRVAAFAAVDLPVTSSRVQVAAFRRPAGPAQHPVIMDFINGTYLRSETGALTLAGSIDPGEAADVVDPDDYPEHADDEFVANMARGVVARWPAMEDSECRRGYASLYGVTPDWHPVIDEVPAASGFFVCAGFSGHGYKLAPAVGLLVGDLVTREAEPTFPATMFRYDRFRAGDLVRGRYRYSIAG